MVNVLLTHGYVQEPDDLRIPVGILGATGLVGQRFVCMLHGHPYFRIAVLGASSVSAGSTYAHATKGRAFLEIPNKTGLMTLVECRPSNFRECKLVFSALDAGTALEVERDFAAAGLKVFTNASSHRLAPDVPLVVPLANADHLRRIHTADPNWIVANANCSATGVAVVLVALDKAFDGVLSVAINTLQAASGAGMQPGIAAMTLIDNVVPFIEGEEEKLEKELPKILGNPELKVSAHCNRVPVLDGHLANISVKLGRRPSSIEEVALALSRFIPPGLPESASKLPSMPNPAIILHSTLDRPQPRLDRDSGKGMAVSVGRLRLCPLLDVRMTVLIHNTVLGAAGSSILNAEIMHQLGYFKAQ